MISNSKLPPSQKEIDNFPRFGLPQYAKRFPSVLDSVKLSISGDMNTLELSEELSSLKRVGKTSDFHCVTTWSKLDLVWSGYRFSDFYNNLIKPHATEDMIFVVLRAQDGYKTSLPLMV